MRTCGCVIRYLTDMGVSASTDYCKGHMGDTLINNDVGDTLINNDILE